MKKRILSLLMAVCLMTTLVSVCSVSASAAEGDVYVYAYNARAKAGETVEIPFYINSDAEFACLTFTPDFDFTALELVNVECGMPVGSFIYNENPTNPKFIWYHPQNVAVGSEPAFTLTFVVKEGAREGKYPVTLLYNENDICDENGSRIPLQVEAGEITIFRYLLADVNNDLSVDSADVVKLARYLVYLETEINTYGADVNKDSNVDGRDLIKLARHMAGAEMIEGAGY